MRLLIVSHTPHYYNGDQLVGWGPTVRELGYLAELFDEIVHVAPLYEGRAPASALSYISDRVRLRLVPPAGGESAADKFGVLRAYPCYATVIGEELRSADAVHVRCPASISLLALVLLLRAQDPGPRWVKYAGNWQPTEPEAWSYTVQRHWLRENRHRGVVTVNGRWPKQPRHIYYFNNPSLTDEDLLRGREAAAGKQLSLPLELLFVGALNEAKGVGRVLQVALRLQQSGVPFRLRLVGDGPERPRYEAWAGEHGLRQVYFEGWVPHQEIPRYTAAAHFILLPSSSSEGWPKVLSEAMAYGAVPIAGAISSIPQILHTTGAGIALPPRDTDGFAAAIAGYVKDPDAWLAASRAGASAAGQFTYRAYQAAVADLFAGAWGIDLPRDMETRLPPAADDTLARNGHVEQ